MSVDSGDALFQPDGDRYLPTDFSRGPWTPDALHGGPVAALVARAVEAAATDVAMHTARLTVELLRPVPVTPLTVTTTVVRPGRKVQLVDVTVASADHDLAFGRALRIRRLTDDDPAAAGLAEVTVTGPEPGRHRDAPPAPDQGHRSPEPVQGYTAFHSAGAELRFVRGEFGRRGPATVWVRLAVPVVPGATPSPLERVAAASDFGNGVSSLFDFQHYVFINPDLTVFVDRPAVGPWIGIEAATALGTPGVGMAQSVLWDVEGPLGRAVQSLLVEHRT
ncbi:MAG: thioesterase family protein [Acidimicrobiales bacterium]